MSNMSSSQGGHSTKPSGIAGCATPLPHLHWLCYTGGWEGGGGIVLPAGMHLCQPPFAPPATPTYPPTHLPTPHLPTQLNGHGEHAGDVAGVRACLSHGEDVHALIDLPNQNKQAVVGVTPLYLAAQQGHLVRSGLPRANTAFPAALGQSNSPTSSASARA